MNTQPTGFAALGVPTPLINALNSMGITTPFPIQAATLPDSLDGSDVLGRGRTGSGKTIAFALPLLVALEGIGPRKPNAPRALVLVPTRELAIQVFDTVNPLAKAVGANAMTIFGGVGQNPQVKALAAGMDVVIATPGRLEDLMGQGHVRLDEVEITVLDEADHMADLGFLPAVKRILDKTPEDAQRLLFSATLDSGVDVLVKRYMYEPVTHSVDEATSPVPTMEHHVLNVETDKKLSVVHELTAGPGRTLCFTRTKHGAKKLAKQLSSLGVPAVDLHGNLSQNARQRNLSAFAEGEVLVLVATDIAARGIHVDDVNLVVHVDPPAEHKAYLHRSGRTARAGSDGVVATIATPDQTGDVRTLMRQAKITPTTTRVAPGHQIIGELRGGEALPPRVVEIAAPVEQRSSGTRKKPQPRGEGTPRGNARGASQGNSRGASQGSSRGRSRGRSRSGSSR